MTNSALELLKSGNPEQALAALKDRIRAEPANVKHRIFYFQLLCVLGEWNKALVQLNVAAEMEPAALPMAQTYREAIRCEALRQEVFGGTRTPLIFGEPPEWVGLLLEALRLGSQGKIEASQELRGRAFEAADATCGSVDGKPFEWLADADPRIGPMFEAVINGKYFWVPLKSVRRLHLDPPEDLRDVVWMPAHFEWTNGGDAVALIPTRYPGSERSDDNAIRLARKTEWDDLGAELFVGLGQRVLTTPEEDHPIMNVRKIFFGSAEEAAAEFAAEDDATAEPEHG